MNNNTVTSEQMELGFAAQRQWRPAVRRQRRLERAAWWFSQMRLAVDRALDWSDQASGPPSQTWLPGCRRELRV